MGESILVTGFKSQITDGDTLVKELDKAFSSQKNNLFRTLFIFIGVRLKDRLLSRMVGIPNERWMARFWGWKGLFFGNARSNFS